jgi:hypothetical protein
MDPLPNAAIFGRDGVVSRLARSRAPLTLLTGDSGIGKSDVLAAAQVGTESTIAPAPRTLPGSGGVLQRILLEGLGEILAEYVRQHGKAREIGEYLIAAGDRLFLQRGEELLRVILQEVLVFVRSKLVGPEFGDAIVGYVTSLRDTVDQRLTARLDNAIDRGAVGLVLDLANEVMVFLDGQTAVIALDAGERLPDSDVRVLGDLSDALPSTLRLRIAMSTYSEEHRRKVDYLLGLANGITEIPLGGLDEEAVAEWLVAESLNPEIAAEVTRVTSGYPLHVGDLLAHIRGGGTIDDAPLHQAFARRTEEAWNGLDPEIAAHARKLCVLLDPLPLNRTLELLRIDASEWGEVEDRLWRSRIFSVFVNGQRWFHEQRRRYLVEVKLGAEELGMARSAAVPILQAMVTESPRLERVAELAVLLAGAAPLLDSDEQLRAAVELDRDQLAICAAIIELVEPNMVLKAIGGDVLLRYTKRVFRPASDLIEAFRRLGNCPFVYIAEVGGQAVAAPQFENTLAALSLFGRAERELGRRPVPSAAGAAFAGEIRPRLGSFLGAGFGAGDAPMARLGHEAVRQRRLLRPRTFVNDRDAGPNLLLRARYAGRAIFSHVCFDDEKARDEALALLRGLTAEVLEQPFEVTDVLPHPVRAVPAARFLRAAGRILGSSLSIDVEGIKARRSLEAPVAPNQRVEIRAKLTEIIRELCTPVERYALGLDQGLTFIFYGTDRSLEVAEVVGTRTGARELDQPLGVSPGDPFRLFRLENSLGLGQGERVSSISFHVSAVPVLDDPAIEALNSYAARAKDFNATQRRLQLQLDAVELEQAVRTAVDRELADATALHQSGVFGDDVEAPSPLAYRLELAKPDVFTSGIFGSPFVSAQAIVELHDGLTNLVTVSISENGGFKTDITEASGENIVTWTQGDGEAVVAALLGHREDDVEFQRIEITGQGDGTGSL